MMEYAGLTTYGNEVLKVYLWSGTVILINLAYLYFYIKAYRRLIRLESH